MDVYEAHNISTYFVLYCFVLFYYGYAVGTRMTISPAHLYIQGTIPAKANRENFIYIRRGGIYLKKLVIKHKGRGGSQSARDENCSLYVNSTLKPDSEEPFHHFKLTP